MGFDTKTRNLLQRFVSKARNLLSDEFNRQIQNTLGMDSKSGIIADLDKLTSLDNYEFETAKILRNTMDHYLSLASYSDTRDVLDRIIREQAFTILNRLCAIKMAESRKLVINLISNGYESDGFLLYKEIAKIGIGDIGQTFKEYIFSIFDEFSIDLNVLFDRFSPQGRLFPKDTVLLELLMLINDPELESFWSMDETIGWIYQYFNSKEERKKMREESQSPRNSRELAVRNQFFTPRYVVEFLTDNTLARIWYEMTQGDTVLKETCPYLVTRTHEVFLKKGQTIQEDLGTSELSQEEFLQKTLYVPFRELKDPRELLLLDPACGSMHFGLYAFDVFEKIYEEAWELIPSIQKDFSSKETYFVQVPKLIIEKNIHGIDIDPRAVQIAGLSLWLRAHKSWQRLEVPMNRRPIIQKSNIVCAEPMPGEEQMRKEFTSQLENKALANLVEQIFEKMQLAGEAGSLLKIEEEIKDAVSKAKEEYIVWKQTSSAQLFQDFFAKPTQLGLDFSGISNEEYFADAEEKVYHALRVYAERASEWGYQKKLFSQDTARGFSFIDLCRKRYDVVLMNPPFGAVSQISKNYIDKTYPKSKMDLLALFSERMIEELCKDGMLGAITSRTPFFLTSFQKWREEIILQKTNPFVFVDLGAGVLDAALVETSAWCIKKS